MTDQHITQGQAQEVIRQWIEGVHSTMVAQNVETQGLILQLRSEVQEALATNKATADEQVETLRGHTCDALRTVVEKISVVAESVSLQTSSQELFEQKMTTLETQLRKFAQDLQTCISQTQAGISAIVNEARDSDGTFSFRPNQERDRQVFDPRDYTIVISRRGFSCQFARSGDTSMRVTSTRSDHSGAEPSLCSSKRATRPLLYFQG